MRRSKRRISASTDNSRREAEASLLFLRSHCRCRGTPEAAGRRRGPQEERAAFAETAWGILLVQWGGVPLPAAAFVPPCDSTCRSGHLSAESVIQRGENGGHRCAQIRGHPAGPPRAGGEGGAAAGERAAQRAAAGFAASLRQQPVPPHRFLNEPRETALERRAANLLRDLRPPEQENGRIVRSFFVRIFRNGA